MSRQVCWRIGARAAAILVAGFVILAAATGGTSNAAGRTCSGYPPPVRDLDLGRYYIDAAGTKIDFDRRAAKARAVAPIKQFMQRLAADTDLLWQPPSIRQRSSWRLTARCAGRALSNWAEAGALLGSMGTKQAKYERNWAFAGLAVSYLKLRPFLADDERRVIDRWLIELSGRCRAFLDDPARKRNNHRYWLGLGLGAVGLALGSDAHWRASRDIMKEAAGAIEPDGALPLELARGARALHYHNFSAQPLFATILLAMARGEDWAAWGDGGFHRLVRLLDEVGSGCSAVAERRFAEAAGHAQERLKAKDFDAGWRQAYAASFPAKSRASGCRMSRAGRYIRRGSDYHRLGGNLTALKRAVDHYADQSASKTRQAGETPNSPLPGGQFSGHQAPR